MKNLTVLLTSLFLTASLHAQILKSNADTLALLEEIPFPQASANMVFGFSSTMLDLYHLPEKNSVKTLEKLLKKYEKDKKNVGLLIDIYFEYKYKNEFNSGLPYLQKAYGIAMELFELNPSNLELVEQLSSMLIEVNRMPDVPALWKDYTERNPKVAKGWAKLGVFQAQMLDVVGCQYSIEKAFELDSEDPELYVAALSQVVGSVILKMQREGETKVKGDFSFFKKAISRKPDSDIVKTAYNSAKLIEYFYTVLINNIDSFSYDAPFKLALDDKQKSALAELEKAFKSQLKQKKIVNKYIILQNLMVIEVLKTNPDLAKAYFEESKKYLDANAQHLKFLSFGYLPQRRFSEAIPLLKKATELSYNYEDLFALARFYFENKEYEKSKEVLNNMLASFPDKTDIAMGIISNLLKERKFEDACSTLFRLGELYKDRDLENKDGYFIFFKAVCTLIYTKKTEEAKLALQAIVDNDSDWAEESAALLKKFFQE
jgi:tetratricopeptide (TPR) repeat protein